jgi:hypothetical protein
MGEAGANVNALFDFSLGSFLQETIILRLPLAHPWWNSR